MSNTLTDRLRAAWRSPDFLQLSGQFVLGAVFFRLPVAMRARLFAGQAHRCPICQSHLRSFPALYRAHMRWCPVCLSLPRHRLVWLFLSSPYVDIENAAKPRRVLHLAPEPGVAARLAQLKHVRYLNADRFDPATQLRLDICSLGLRDQCFDLVYCSHVLEHVQDDRLAMTELRRLLKPDGHAIILVPITASATDEDPTVTDPAERERRFGQHDHVRCYGPDFADRLRSTGFVVQPITSTELGSADDARTYGINPRETIFWCHPR